MVDNTIIKDLKDLYDELVSECADIYQNVVFNENDNQIVIKENGNVVLTIGYKESEKEYYITDAETESEDTFDTCNRLRMHLDETYAYTIDYEDEHLCPHCGEPMRSMITDDPMCSHSLVEGYECPNCKYDSIYDN